MPEASSSLRGWLVCPEGVTFGRIAFAGGLITALEDLPPPEREEPAPYILPGFIDTHVHGGGGGDTMDGAEGIEALCRLHAQRGTAALLPTTVTNPWDRVLAALRAVTEVRERQQAAEAAGESPTGAQVLGAHLEGPFISPGRLGAQPPHALAPTPALVAEALATGNLRAVTLAPEVPGALAAAQELAAAGVRIGIGHTRASADETAAFIAALTASGLPGQVAATHLFNAMGGIEGRAPGPAGALLASPAAYLEVIFDLQHIHPLNLQLARAAAPGRVMLITDAIRAAGLGDGPSELGGQPLTVRGGRAELPDGTLAGSVLTMGQAVRNALSAGVPLPEAARLAATHPARSLGLTDRGELRTGLRADLTMLGADFAVRAVYIGGWPLQF